MRALSSSVLAVVLFALGSQPAFAHKFHASLAEVEYVPSTHVVEVAIRVFPDDLEDALAQRAHKHVRLDRTPNAEQLAAEYVQTAFRLVDATGNEARFEWVGMEVKADSAWLYVQASAPNGVAGMKLRDALFFELFPDQVNTVNVKQASARATLVFKTGDAEQAIALSVD
jgi:hypothetical protein